MADIRTNAYAIFESEGVQAKLKNVIAGVIENFQKRTISELLKNQQGTPMGAGSMSYKRFVNSGSAAYGTARAAGEAGKLTAPEVVVNLDQKKEIIEEFNKFDLETFGIDGIAGRRQENYRRSLSREQERVFFANALVEGNQGFAIDNTAANIEADLEAKIQALETLQNDYVDGVERDMMALVLKPAVYGTLKNKLNDTRNTTVMVEGEEIPAFNGVAIFSSTYLPTAVDGILMVRGAIAKPIKVDEYDLDKIQLSNDWALALFYDYGIKALTPDLIFAFVTGAVSGTNTFSVVSALPGTGTADVIYVGSAEITLSGTNIPNGTYPAGTMYTWETDHYEVYTG